MLGEDYGRPWFLGSPSSKVSGLAKRPMAHLLAVLFSVISFCFFRRPATQTNADSGTFSSTLIVVMSGFRDIGHWP